MNNPFLTKRSAEHEDVFERAYRRAEALDQLYQQIKDGAALISQAIEKLRAADAYGPLPYRATVPRPVGATTDGGPIYGPRVVKIDLAPENISQAAEEFARIDVGECIFSQASEWADEEWGARP